MALFGPKVDVSKFAQQVQSDIAKNFTQGLSTGLKSAALSAVVTVGETTAQYFVKSMTQGATNWVKSRIDTDSSIGKLGATLIDSIAGEIQKSANARVKHAASSASQSLAAATNVSVRGANPPAPPAPPPAPVTPQAWWQKSLGLGGSLMGSSIGAGAAFFATERSLGNITNNLSTALQTTIQLTETMGSLQRNVGNTSRNPKAFMGLLGAGQDLGMLPQDAASVASLFLPAARNGTARDVFQQLHFSSAFGMNSDQWAASMASAVGAGLTGGAKGGMSTSLYQAMLAQSFAGTSGLAKMQDYATGAQDIARIIAASTVTTPSTNNILQLYSAINKTGIAGLSGVNGAAVLGQLNQGIVNGPTSGSPAVQMAYYQALGGKNGISPSALRFQTEEGLSGNNFGKLLAYSNKEYAGYSKMDKLYAQSQIFGLNMHQTQAVIDAYGNGHNGFSMQGLYSLVGGKNNLNNVNASQYGLLTQLAAGQKSKVASEMIQQQVAGAGEFLRTHHNYTAQQLANVIMKGGTPQTSDIQARGAINAVQRPLQNFTQWIGTAAIAVQNFAGSFGGTLPWAAWATYKGIGGLRAARGAKATGEDSATDPAAKAVEDAASSPSVLRRAVSRASSVAADALPLAGAAAGFMDTQSHQEAAYNLTQTSLAHLPASVRKLVQGGKLTSYYNPKTRSFELAHTGHQAKGYYQMQANPLDNGYGVRAPLYQPPGWWHMSHLPQVPYNAWFGDTTLGWNPRAFANGILGLGGNTYIQPGLLGSRATHAPTLGPGQRPRGGGASGVLPMSALSNMASADNTHLQALGEIYFAHTKAASLLVEQTAQKDLSIYAPLPKRTIRQLSDNLATFLTNYGKSLTDWQRAALGAIPSPGAPGGVGGPGSGGGPGGTSGGGGGSNTFAGFRISNPQGAVVGTIGSTGHQFYDQERGNVYSTGVGAAIKLPQGGRFDARYSTNHGAVIDLPGGKAFTAIHIDANKFKNGQFLPAGTVLGTTTTAAQGLGYSYFGTNSYGMSQTQSSDVGVMEADIYGPGGGRSAAQNAFVHGATGDLSLDQWLGGLGSGGGAGIKVPPGLPNYLKKLYMAAGAKYHVPWQFLAAQGYKESRWNPKAVQPGGYGRGIAQFDFTPGANAANSNYYLGGGGVAAAMNPALAIPAQAAYMHALMQQEGGSLWKAARDYNGTGPNAVNYANSLVGPQGSGGASGSLAPSGAFQAEITLKYANGVKETQRVTFHPKQAGIPYTAEGQAAAHMGGRAPRR